MATLQLSLDFTKIAQIEEQGYPIAYLENAYKICSASSLTDRNKIKGIFYHLGSPYACVGASFQWGINQVSLSRLYSSEEWQSRQNEKPHGHLYYWGREIQFRGKNWIMGDRLTLKADPHERAIAIAKDKISWSIAKLERTLPHATGEKRDPSWGIDWYQGQAEEARSLLLEGLEEAENLGIPIDQDRIFQINQKLDKIREKFNV